MPLDQRIYLVVDYIRRFPTLEERKKVYRALKIGGVITKQFEKRAKELGF